MSADSRIELLAPAGDERALRAALAAGADAVYFGLERWSARAFAGNFAGDEAARAVDLAHLYGARAHLALNTLLKDDELEPALAALAAPYAAGLDALIVTDLGFASLVCERYPDLELHASTQLNTHSSAQLGALARLGFRRAILARELSLGEIAALDTHGLDLEAFVHGALCYGYSGDCLLSSMVGGRSGNRGRCSQSCRMRYRLSAAGGPASTKRPATAAASEAGAGSPAPAGSAANDADGITAAGSTRALSTGDLCALAALPGLMAAGVTSFKIEGRMKDAAYVAVTTAVYREALDASLADPAAYVVRPEWLARLEQSFSRGFTTAHLDGRHDEVRSGGRGGHRGVLVGRVESFDEEAGIASVRLARPVAAGDVVYLYTSWGQTDPARVEVAASERLTLRVRERVAVKDRLFRLSAAETSELARELTSGRHAARPVMLEARLEGRAGEPARLALRVLPDGPRAESTSSQALGPARNVALDEERVRAAVGALGGTPYELAGLDLKLEGRLFLAVGDLKGMRRRAVAALDAARLAARRRTPAGTPGAPAGAPDVPAWSAAGEGTPAPPTRRPRAREARDVVLRLRPGEAPIVAPDVGAVCLDLLADDSADAVAAALAALRGTGLPVRCRLPEILFDADREWLAAVLELDWDVVYARHLGLVTQADGLVAQADGLVAPAGELVAPAGELGASRSGAPFTDLTPVARLACEYPLQGLNGLTPAVLARLAGAAPAAVVVSPEAALGEVVALAAALARLDPPPAVEALAFGREQVLRARDRLGRTEGLVGVSRTEGLVGVSRTEGLVGVGRAGGLLGAPGPTPHVDLLLEDAKGYVFPAEVDHAGTRLFNARLTNLAANLDELRAAGVTCFLVVQRDLSPDEGRAFASGGLPALAAFVARERTTTGHLFRGVS